MGLNPAVIMGSESRLVESDANRRTGILWGLIGIKNSEYQYQAVGCPELCVGRPTEQLLGVSVGGKKSPTDGPKQRLECYIRFPVEKKSRPHADVFQFGTGG